MKRIRRWEGAPAGDPEFSDKAHLVTGMFFVLGPGSRPNFFVRCMTHAFLSPTPSHLRALFLRPPAFPGRIWDGEVILH